MRRPNILFMLSDDHAVRAISACGSVVNETPHLDRISNEGALFEQSYCCNSICTPSRAAILTGKHSFQNGVLTLQESLNPKQVTFPRLLKQAGYQTALVGKWHLHCEPQDFDFWKVLPGQGNYYNPEYLTPEGSVHEKGYSEDLTTDTIIDWIKGRNLEAPFLACCHFKAPHRAWYPPLRHLGKHTDTKLPEPLNLNDNYANRCELLKKNKMMIARHMFWDTDLKVQDPGPNAHRLGFRSNGSTPFHEDQRNYMNSEELAIWDDFYSRRQAILQDKEMDDQEFLSWAYQAYLQDYLGCVAAIDDNVGRLLNMLDEEGLADNTIVVYCSDQGFYLGEHGWYDKRWMFEESMRTPLLMRWPGKIQPGSRYQQLVQNIDYAPTLLEACGVEIPAEMQGVPLQRVFEGQEIRDDLYYHYYADGQHGVPAHDGIRTKTHKLIHFYTSGEFNLFDLQSDPMEMQSVHQHPACADILEDLKRRYTNARRQYEVPDEFPPKLPEWSRPRMPGH